MQTSATIPDTRPRVEYVLPDGQVVRVIHDHGQYAQATIDYQLAGGRIVTATRRDIYQRAGGV